MFAMTDLINTIVNPWNKQTLGKTVGAHNGGQSRGTQVTLHTGNRMKTNKTKKCKTDLSQVRITL